MRPPPAVVLRVAEDEDLPDLVAVAVRGARPREVMPADTEPDPDRWTATREHAYASFLRSRRTPPAGGIHETPLLVEVDGEVAGLARLLWIPSGSDCRVRVETGVWLSRAVRGRGVAVALLDALVTRARAAGADLLVADTTADNAPALAALRRLGAVLSARDGDPDVVDAVIALNAPPHPVRL